MAYKYLDIGISVNQCLL